MNRNTRLQIERIRHAAESLERVFADLSTIVKPGITTRDVDHVARLALKRNALVGVLEGYGGFPAVACTSVNNVAAHGVPGEYVLRSGDILTVDISGDLNGWKADAAWTYAIGSQRPESRRLLRAAWQATIAGASAAKPGARLGDIGAAISRVAASNGCSTVREFTGHGIGVSLHEEPVVPHEGTAGTGPVLDVGTVLNIEPVLTLGNGSVTLLDDGWSYVTSDGSLSAQFEVTVAVAPEGPRILTLGRHPQPPGPLPPYGAAFAG